MLCDSYAVISRAGIATAVCSLEAPKAKGKDW
jgi:hypothetical protein